jgi:tRNA 2-selenouridine synthase
MVAKNIARHLETRFKDHPKAWRPLIYCWRGGQRSGAMSIILSQVGWAAHKLEGGYKTYRRDVLDQLALLPQNYTYQVICGPTGSGKTRLLSAMSAEGLQVLDLENLAQHRGSMLGRLPEQNQPSQKRFDSELLLALQKLDPARPVNVEAESNKIGLVTLPPSLVAAMHASSCTLLEVPLAARIKGLLEDYRHYVNQPALLIQHLQPLRPFHGEKQLQRWTHLIETGNFSTMVGELLTLHYDPSYLRATSKHYLKLPDAKTIQLTDLSADALRGVAATL